MAKARRTGENWREKLENPVVGLPTVVEFTETWRKSQGGRYVLVPMPLMADEAIRRVCKGKLMTCGQPRRRLAESQKTDSTCPMTLGLFMRITSEAAEEDRQSGRKRITPYRRVVKDGGSLNPKLAGGVEAQAAQLEAEGRTVVAGKGTKPPGVENFEKALV